MRKPIIPLLLIVFLSMSNMAQAPPPNPPGRLVDIGGYRLHLNCVGRGSPTVLLDYGASGNSMVWALVQPKVARFTRVCSYDRAYEGWSDAGPIPPTMRQQVYELHKLLGIAHIRPPYVLAGWSLGGMIDRLYVDAYPTEVKGMVLVDATHEDIAFGEKRFRDLATGKTIPEPQTMKSSPPQPLTPDEQKHYDDWKAQKVKESQLPAPSPWDKLSARDLNLWRFADMNAKPISSARGRQEEWLPEELQQVHESRKNNPHPLGNIPLVVLAVGKGEGNAHEPSRADQIKDMGTLSTNSRVFVDETSYHGIPISDPELVVRSVRDVYRAAKTHNALITEKTIP
jgi:pimeloyl-ACP methyl ester carboxylesterase